MSARSSKPQRRITPKKRKTNFHPSDTDKEVDAVFLVLPHLGPDRPAVKRHTQAYGDFRQNGQMEYRVKRGNKSSGTGRFCCRVHDIHRPNTYNPSSD